MRHGNFVSFTHAITILRLELSVHKAQGRLVWQTGHLMPLQLDNVPLTLGSCAGQGCDEPGVTCHLHHRDGAFRTLWWLGLLLVSPGSQRSPECQSDLVQGHSRCSVQTASYRGCSHSVRVLVSVNVCVPKMHVSRGVRLGVSVAGRLPVPAGGVSVVCTSADAGVLAATCPPPRGALSPAPFGLQKSGFLRSRGSL